MNVQNIFYGVGIFFAIVFVFYFVLNYLEEVPAQTKSVLAFLLAVILFVLGDYLRRLNK